MIQERFIADIQSWIMETQFGFRRKKSTAQAVFSARRVIDRAETGIQSLLDSNIL